MEQPYLTTLLELQQEFRQRTGFKANAVVVPMSKRTDFLNSIWELRKTTELASAELPVTTVLGMQVYYSAAATELYVDQLTRAGGQA